MKQGIVMEIQADTAYVFTSDLSMISLPVARGMFVGQSIELPAADAAARETQASGWQNSAVDVLRSRGWQHPAAVAPRPRGWRHQAPVASRSRGWRIPVLAAAACVLFLLCTGLMYAFVIVPSPGTVYLSLDINPSVEFVLGADRKVADVIPMNSDAWAVLSQNDFRGLTFEQAIAFWVSLTRQKMPDHVDQLLVSAILTRRDRGFADAIMSLDSSRGNPESRSRAGLEALPVKVVYTMDAAVKEKADANGLSFGRQMLLDKALSNAPAIDPESIRSAPLKPLVDLLLQDNGVPGPSALLGLIGGSTKPGTTGNTGESIAQTTAKPTLPATSADPTETKPTEPAMTVPTEPSTQPTAPAATTAATTAKPTTKATTAATTAKPTTTAASGPQLQVTSNGSDGWRLQWTQAAAGRDLYYYKVVISQSVSQPKYPDNGYLYALSKAENSCQAANGSAYHSGDFGGYLVPGQAYYVGITYVYADGKAYSNVLRLTYNGPGSPTPTTMVTTSATTSAFTPTLAGSSLADGLSLSWDRSPDGRPLSYYKVVISKSNSTPVYPTDGHLYALSIDQTSCRADNSSAYNGGDFGGWLVPGQAYYVRITYVFSDGSKVNSNVLRLTYNGPAHA